MPIYYAYDSFTQALKPLTDLKTSRNIDAAIVKNDAGNIHWICWSSSRGETSGLCSNEDEAKNAILTIFRSLPTELGKPVRWRP